MVLAVVGQQISLFENREFGKIWARKNVFFLMQKVHSSGGENGQNFGFSDFFSKSILRVHIHIGRVWGYFRSPSKVLTLLKRIYDARQKGGGAYIERFWEKTGFFHLFFTFSIRYRFLSVYKVNPASSRVSWGHRTRK